jgi:N6-adenosine-specific RNA methylase IME4
MADGVCVGADAMIHEERLFGDEVPSPAPRDPAAIWAERIRERWQDSVEAIFDVGRLLVRAKGELEDFEWRNLLQQLPFNGATVRKLKLIAEDERLLEFQKRSESNKNGTCYPASWNTLYLLTTLDDDVLRECFENGAINPGMRGSDIRKIVRLERVHADEARVLTLKPIEGKFRTIVLDPAWEYDWLSLAGRAKPGYAMQTLEALASLDVMQWAEPECHLYCWTTNNFMGEACKLIARWGFQHRTVITWIKPPPFGLGSYFRNSTEHALFATLGDTTTRPAAASLPTHFEAPRGEHSEKPDKFYDIVRAASYPPYGEGNQRESRADFVNLFESACEAAE